MKRKFRFLAHLSTKVKIAAVWNINQRGFLGDSHVNFYINVLLVELLNFCTPPMGRGKVIFEVQWYLIQNSIIARLTYTFMCVYSDFSIWYQLPVPPSSHPKSKALWEFESQSWFSVYRLLGYLWSHIHRNPNAQV